jgi:hypothetical protein
VRLDQQVVDRRVSTPKSKRPRSVHATASTTAARGGQNEHDDDGHNHRDGHADNNPYPMRHEFISLPLAMPPVPAHQPEVRRRRGEHGGHSYPLALAVSIAWIIRGRRDTRLIHRIRSVQTGSVNDYLAYQFVGLIAVIVAFVVRS